MRREKWAGGRDVGVWGLEAGCNIVKQITHSTERGGWGNIHIITGRDG